MRHYMIDPDNEERLLKIPPRVVDDIKAEAYMEARDVVAAECAHGPTNIMLASYPPIPKCAAPGCYKAWPHHIDPVAAIDKLRGV